LRAAATIARKDLLVELRTKESVPAMALFAITTFVIFHFGLNRDTLEGELAAGVLWVTLLFAAILGINRLFVAEREQGGFDGILMAPIERGSLLLGKVAALFIYLVALEVIAIPVFGLFFIQSGFWDALPKLAAVALLADLGIALVGAMLASIAVHTRARDLLLPLLLLPLTVPAVIAAASATKLLLSVPPDSSGIGKWLAVLALYDAVFGLIAYALFDFLMED
jgi:heme exporter protein B